MNEAIIRLRFPQEDHTHVRLTNMVVDGATGVASFCCDRGSYAGGVWSSVGMDPECSEGSLLDLTNAGELEYSE